MKYFPILPDRSGETRQTQKVGGKYVRRHEGGFLAVVVRGVFADHEELSKHNTYFGACMRLNQEETV